MSPLCPTCDGDCCADKRGSVVDHGSALARHSCPDCPDGFAPAPAPDFAAARLAALMEAECENTTLRAEVSYLRACVPPTRPTDYGHEVWTAALRAEVRTERAAVVAWLREAWGAVNLVSTSIVSAEIERGEHRCEEEK